MTSAVRVQVLAAVAVGSMAVVRAPAAGPAPAKGERQVTDEDRRHWAFRPLQLMEPPTPPCTPGGALPTNPMHAFLASPSAAWRVSVDGVEGNANDGIGSEPVFSPDSMHVAYDAKRGEKWILVVDGAESGGYDSFLRGATPAFAGPRSLLILAVRGQGMEVALVEITIEGR